MWNKRAFRPARLFLAGQQQAGRDSRCPFRFTSLQGVWLVFVFLVFALPSVQGQNRKDLVEKRRRLIEEIKQTEGELQETQENKNETLTHFFTLQNKIQKRQQLINNLQAEITFANESIERSNEVLAGLAGDIERLKGEYANMLRGAYRHKINQSFIVFLFSSRNLNDAYRRWQYLRQYDQFRRRQAALISETQKMLRSKNEQLQKRLQEKEQLLNSEQSQKKLLSSELAVKDRLLKNLKDDESRLVTELERYRKSHEQLNVAIESVIREEMAKQKKTARSPEALSASNAEPSGALSAVSNQFLRKKGQLSWPVREGEITRFFGTQPHPSIKTVQISNNGIDIRTAEGAHVFAVFAGTVAGIKFIPGYQNMVIVQHGQYYTVYSNLEQVFVKPGDPVAEQEAVGKLGSRKPEVHFEVWREKERLDPIQWVNKP